MRRLAGFLAIVLSLLTSAASQPQAESNGGILRVGGDYQVGAVTKGRDGSFHIEFRSVQPTGKFDTLTLDSDHVHVAVKIGQKVRLSAEILSEKGASAEVAQVVLFLNTAVGRVPVWLLSNRAPDRDLRASKYLEMHLPSTDYQIM